MSDISKIYLAGPMTGIELFNYPQFHRVATALREDGNEVVSPAETVLPNGTICQLDPPTADDARPHTDYLREGLAKLLECDAIALLPGYADSRGAMLELRVAEELGMTVIVLVGIE